MPDLIGPVMAQKQTSQEVSDDFSFPPINLSFSPAWSSYSSCLGI